MLIHGRHAVKSFRPLVASRLSNQTAEQASTRTTIPNNHSASFIAGKPVPTRSKVVVSKSDRKAKRGRRPAPDEALPATKKKKAKDSRTTRPCIVCLDDKPTVGFPVILHSDESGAVHHSGVCSDCWAQQRLCFLCRKSAQRWWRLDRALSPKRRVCELRKPNRTAMKARGREKKTTTKKMPGGDQPRLIRKPIACVSTKSRRASIPGYRMPSKTKSTTRTRSMPQASALIAGTTIRKPRSKTKLLVRY